MMFRTSIPTRLQLNLEKNLIIISPTMLPYIQCLAAPKSQPLLSYFSFYLNLTEGNHKYLLRYCRLDAVFIVTLVYECVAGLEKSL